MVITLSGSVLFATNQSALLPGAQARLDDVAGALMAAKERNVLVEGHTDSRGGRDANIALSQRRAEAVRSYLMSRGYPSDKIAARGIGQERPVAENGTAEGRANNRRVEIVVERSSHSSLP
jgi:outer membrane protein OmpA-like peptidoglycan-associated protein